MLKSRISSKKISKFCTILILMMYLEKHKIRSSIMTQNEEYQIKNMNYTTIISEFKKLCSNLLHLAI